jgi:autotransporter passenger strand-loop-strand repeat protein
MAAFSTWRTATGSTVNGGGEQDIGAGGTAVNTHRP